MLIVAPNTVLNPAALETRRVPKKLFRRVAILPRRAGPAAWARILFDAQLLRYLGALAPFVAAMLIWPRLAFPIAQAPILMVLLVGVVEMKVLRLSASARKDVIDEDDAARALDTLRFRATRILSRIAARRGLSEGKLHLVVEQSELARVVPLTLVSVQRAGPGAEVLALDTSEQEMLRAELFAEGLDERTLHRANLREDVFLRDVGFAAEGVSAHARLAALMDAAPAREVPA